MTEQNQSVTVYTDAIPAEFQPVVKSSGVARGDHHAATFAPFMIQFRELAERTKSINRENPTATDMKVARAIRLDMVKNRTATAKQKDASKAGLLAEGNLIQALHNVVVSVSQLAEADLQEVEDFVLNQEKARIAALVQARTSRLHAEGIEPYGYDLSGMSDDVFEQLITSHRLFKKEQKRLELEAEQERIRKQNEELERQAKMMEENERLKKEAEEAAEAKRKADAALEAERAEAKKKQDEIEAKAKKEKEEADKKLAFERAEAKRKQDEADAAIRKAEADKKAALDKIEADRKAAEAEARKKEQEAAEAKRKADAAPDVEKLQALAAGLVSYAIGNAPTNLSTPYTRAILADIQSKVKEIQCFVEKQIQAI